MRVKEISVAICDSDPTLGRERDMILQLMQDLARNLFARGARPVPLFAAAIGLAEQMRSPCREEYPRLRRQDGLDGLFLRPSALADAESEAEKDA